MSCRRSRKGCAWQAELRLRGTQSGAQRQRAVRTSESCWTDRTHQLLCSNRATQLTRYASRCSRVQVAESSFTVAAGSSHSSSHSARKACTRGVSHVRPDQQSVAAQFRSPGQFPDQACRLRRRHSWRAGRRCSAQARRGGGTCRHAVRTLAGTVEGAALERRGS